MRFTNEDYGSLAYDDALLLCVPLCASRAFLVNIVAALCKPKDKQYAHCFTHFLNLSNVTVRFFNVNNAN